jgi:hypothetical protein
MVKGPNDNPPISCLTLKTLDKKGFISISVYSENRCDDHADVALLYSKKDNTVVDGIIISVALLKSLLNGVRDYYDSSE